MTGVCQSEWILQQFFCTGIDLRPGVCIKMLFTEVRVRHKEVTYKRNTILQDKNS
jgi:hypothetical protein